MEDRQDTFSRRGKLPLAKKTLMAILEPGIRRKWGGDVRSILRHLLTVKGWSTTRIGREVGLDAATVVKAAKFYGLGQYIVPGRPKLPPIILTDEEIECYSVKELAKKYDVSESFLYKELGAYAAAKKLTGQTVCEIRRDSLVGLDHVTTGDTEFPWDD